MIQIYLRICWYYIVNKTTSFKTKAKTKTEGHKTKTKKFGLKTKTKT